LNVDKLVSVLETTQLRSVRIVITHIVLMVA